MFSDNEKWIQKFTDFYYFVFSGMFILHVSFLSGFESTFNGLKASKAWG